MGGALIIGFDSSVLGLSLASIEWYSQYRTWSGFSNVEIQAIEEAKFKEDFGCALSACFLVEGGVVLGFALVLPADWDSRHFGLKMATVKLAGAPGVEAKSLALLLRKAVDEAFQKSSIRHFSLSADCDNYSAVNAAILCGFEILDIKRAYSTSKLYPNPVFERFSSSIRPYQASDYHDVQSILDQVSFQSRFSRDVFLEQKRVKGLYKLWFDKLIGQAGGEASVTVGVRAGKVVACHGLGEMDFSHYGISRKVRVGSLFAAVPAAQGLYGPISYQSARHAIETHGLVEATVSLNLPVTTRTLEAIRPNRTVTSYSFRLAL